MFWLTLTTLFAAQAIGARPAAPELDVLVKLEPGVSVGVDEADRWVFATELGERILLPEQVIRYAAPAGLAEARDRVVAHDSTANHIFVSVRGSGIACAQRRAIRRVENAHLSCYYTGEEDGRAVTPDGSLNKRIKSFKSSRI